MTGPQKTHCTEKDKEGEMGGGKTGGEGGGRCPFVSDKVQRVVTIVCCFLFSCTMGISYTFGNINPYLTSYIRNRTGEHDIDYTDTLWISQTRTISSNGVMTLVGFLAVRIHTKLYLLLAVIIHSTALFGTYWSLQESFALVVVTYGLVHGVTHAMVYPTAVRLAMGWVPERKGFICGVVLTGYGLGAVAWNEMTTWFINPDNLVPDLTVGEDVYYTQAEVLDNVPDCFLLLGVIFGSIQLFCILIMCLPPPPIADTTDNISEGETKITGPSQSKHFTETTFSGGGPEHKSYGSIEDVKAFGTVEGTQEAPNYHPKDLLKSRVFWTIWFMMAISKLGIDFVTYLFKAYGQTFIADDHFLTLVASLSSVFNAAGRPFWGLLADRMGYRVVVVIVQCLLAALVVTFATTEDMGKVGFLVWVCAMILTIGGFFTLIPPLTHALFGSPYFNANMGLVETNGVVGALLPALLAPVLKDSFGWHGMFYFGFGGLLASALLNLSLSIQCGNGIPKHMRPVLSLSG